MTDRDLSRRRVLRGSPVAAAGALAGYLTAHGSAAARSGRGTTAANAYGPPTRNGRRLLIALADVPPGGGVLLRDDPVVLTRTATGELHAFSAVCTHQGCTVDSVTDGPAPRPLPPIAVGVLIALG
jgi:Rieske Fe-S protein